jgi:wyosine [tRNA(Phe)-imidazoG37] synthetase (radical SAM superfamily)
LELGVTADYITFAGSGEPTLNSELGKMIRETKKLTNTPLAVITNGSLLDEQEIRDAISVSDVLIPSLDAGTERTFRAVNRSAPGISFVGMREGLVQTAQEFPGQIWLEIMLVEGINDTDSELHAMREIVRRVCPEKLQINTVERPSKSGEARRVSKDTLIKAQMIFGEKAEIIVNSAVAPTDNQEWREVEEELVCLLSRRPCTIGDIVAVSGHNVFEITKYLQRLQTKGLIEQTGENDPYYRRVTGE